MSADARIPIVIGVTGHRTLRAADVPALEATVRAQLLALRAACPHSPVRMLNSLAEGADQLCARVALSMGMPLVAALPMAAEEYRKDFSGEALTAFDALISDAQEVLVTPPAERPPEKPARDFHYRQAGIFVCAHAHVLIALWDGGAPKPGGCGAAEAVDIMLHSRYRSMRGNALRSDGDGAVLHILCPRGEIAGEAGTVSFIGRQATYEDILKKTDDFNRRAAAFGGKTWPLLEAGTETDGATARMDAIYRQADGLSSAAARTYKRVLGLLALTGMVVALAFLLYDELEMAWMLLLCGLMLLLAALTYRFAGKRDCHGVYLEYRALAETLRVQVYLRLAGTPVQAAELLTWTQRTETVWIKEALAALNAAALPESNFDIRSGWIQGQRDYHRRAEKRAKAQLNKNETIMRTALIASVAAYLIALLFELLCGGIFPPVLPLAARTVAVFHIVLKIVVGALSASTLFAANYYGKLSLRRKLSDHEKMALLYEKALSQWDAYGRTEALITELAREELIENGNWCSYQRDNRPDISL